MTEESARSPEQIEDAGRGLGPRPDGPRRFDLKPMRGRAFYSRLEFIRVILLVLGVLSLSMAAYTEWLALQPVDLPGLVLPTLDFPRVTPVQPTSTEEPPGTPADIEQAAAGTATAEAALSNMPVQTLAPTAAPTPRPTAGPAPPTAQAPPSSFPAPRLLEPGDGATLSQRAVFRWLWSGPRLGQRYAFDLRIWSDQEERSGADRRGAVAPTQLSQAEVDLAYVPAILDYGPGDYYWTVVLVELPPGSPPQVVGTWGESRRFVYR